ncbi:MAG TPA: tetratricopeptide repeat protein [Gemmatimonadota bacterium]|nr:tetratricopeptide repeat protein [Gemmatimonadota bacterium]
MEPKHSRTIVTLLAVLVGLVGVRAGLEAQDGGGSGRAQVIVAPLKTQGVDKDFGKDVAKKVREGLEKFDLLAPVDKDRLEHALDQYKLDENSMDLVSWRQLAGRINAQLIISGTAERSGDGTRVDVVFVDAKRGEKMEVPSFTVQGTDKDQAAQKILGALDTQVKFLRAVANCNDYLSGNQYDDAVRNCDQALSINPKSGRALYLRGRVAMKLEKWDEATGYLKKVVDMEPSNEDAIQSLAYSNAQLGNQERALELYKQYLQFNPDNQQIRLSVAYNLASAGAYDQAIQVIRQGLERDSTSAAMWKYLGDVALKKGTEGDRSQMTASSSIGDTSAVRTAIDAYHKYLGLQPDSATSGIYRNIVAAELQLGELDQADQESMQAIHALTGKNPALWSLRADVLAQQGHLEQAVAAMDSTLAADSSYSNAYFKRGLFELRAGMGDKAIRDFHTAVDENGQDPNQIANALFGRGYQDYFKKGQSLASSGNYAAARGQYQTAASLFTTALDFARQADMESQLNFWAGYAYYKVGDAIDNVNKANENPECQLARDALSAFQKVGGYMSKAGSYQQQSQKSVTDGTDVYTYRQNQLIKKACK